MHVVKPRGIIIADTGVDPDEMNDYLVDIGAIDWAEPDYHSPGEFLIEVAGRTCYKSFGTTLNANLTQVRKDHVDYIGNILRTHHGSVLEHATCTVALVDVSRILTHELVRHRAGCAYSQESMRFVRLDDVGMFIPSCIESDPTAREMFVNAVKHAELVYKALCDQMITDDMPFSKKKEVTSAIRRIAPAGHSTTIIVTANHRAWRHLFELRTAPGVEEEIGIVFHKLSFEFLKRYPAFYQDMHHEYIEGSPWEAVKFDHSKI